MATKDMNDWVARVLGVTIGAPSGGDSASTGTFSVMRLGKARVEWIGVRRAAVSEIERLRETINAEFKDDEEQAAQLAAALGELGQRINYLNPTLEEQLDALLNASPAEQGKFVGVARDTLEQFISYLDTDELMMEFDGNEVLPDMVVVAPMRAALSNIAAAMQP